MSNETQFVQGIRVKHPTGNAPDYIKYKVGINRQELIEWLNAQEVNRAGYINAEIKESQNGNPYIALDTWKPDQDKAQRQERPEAPLAEDEGFGDAPF